jgi:hypothetical protein
LDKPFREKKQMKRVLSVLATAAALAGCAATPPARQAMAAGEAGVDVAAKAQCFRYSEMRNHKKADDSTLYLRLTGGSIYRLDMAGNCLAGAMSSDPLVLTRRGGSDMICSPIDLDLKIGGGSPGSFPRPCIVDRISRLTPEQAAALPAKVRP